MPKVVSVNILYFDLGQGEDYVYIGRTRFQGMHKADALALSPQKKGYADRYIGSGQPIYPIGVEFSRERRRVVGFAVETLAG